MYYLPRLEFYVDKVRLYLRGKPKNIYNINHAPNYTVVKETTSQTVLFKAIKSITMKVTSMISLCFSLLWFPV